ncbi:hypothetical protein IFR09_14390 [Pseudomonas syringae]|nr:hypothetical protein [Pseudomonas syringae]MBD8789783.1 hypothetical protein [Pseudomonas syringae]MBD8800972.1 hypothetical protein [Pseudomonas syringae]MBD8812353.1 hypothetical protein [Pseudomonas syringae]
MTEHARTTVPSDWKTQPLPALYVTLPLDFTLTAEETVAARRGLIPQQMEDKWFFYFIDDTLYQHRSWTGNCMYQVHFIPHEGGLRATHAEVNRDPEQYKNVDDAEDIERIEMLTRYLVRTQLQP